MSRIRRAELCRFRPASILAAFVLLLSASCSSNSGGPTQAPKQPAGNQPTGATAASAPEDGQWPMPAKNYASTRFSGLDEINTGNVQNLKVAWTFSVGVNRGQEAAPIVVGDTMYVVTPYPNILYALDLTKEKQGSVKWSFDPKTAAAAQGVACCDYVNRGAVFADGKVVFNTLDGQTIAVDAASGKEVWRAHLGDINKGESVTMAPLVVKDKVLVGNSGGEFGVRGWLTALNLSDGSVAWKAYSTGPDADVLIGPNFKAFYPQNRGTDLGVSTWPEKMWQIGGGTVWGWISYDPEQRPGDNLWTSGIFARNPDTGQAAWFYQWSPHDLHDYDGINEQILLDLPVNGHTRKVLVRPERNGYVYVLDRATGEVLSANPFMQVTSSTGVDTKTGKLLYNPEMEPKAGQVVRGICPAAPGAKDWQPSSFSPRTGLVYIPHQNLCMDEQSTAANYIEGTPFVGMNVKMYAGPGGNRGELCAWDPVKGNKVWAIQENFPVWSGTVVTAGDVVFYGTMDGWFKAVDARPDQNGKVLWSFKVGSGIIGQPTTFRGPDGKQYVAILSGVGGWPGAIVAAGLDPRDATGALGFTNAVKDLPQFTTAGGMLYVFSLP
ncbi:MAG: methanol/ethanol family PQQ-dependent dehydrogenase [Acidobacteriota bacterium]|nr:methanol/ethanol family PQQ-dependent dehydrogenase [Acidobacteriota bacterium]